MLGMGVALLQNRGMLRPEPRVAGWLLTGVAASLGALVLSHEFMARITAYDMVAQPLLIAILFTAALTAATSLSGVRLPGQAIARVGARLAYPLYLTHYALIPLSLHIAGTAGGFWTAYLGLSLGSAVLLHFLVEKPCLIARGRSASNKSSILA